VKQESEQALSNLCSIGVQPRFTRASTRWASEEADVAVLSEDTLEIYVDGSSLSKPRRGGVGIRFVWIDPAGHAAHSASTAPTPTTGLGSARWSCVLASTP
jgi:hypothetical protein